MTSSSLHYLRNPIDPHLKISSRWSSEELRQEIKGQLMSQNYVNPWPKLWWDKSQTDDIPRIYKLFVPKIRMCVFPITFWGMIHITPSDSFDLFPDAIFSNVRKALWARRKSSSPLGCGKAHVLFFEHQTNLTRTGPHGLPRGRYYQWLSRFVSLSHLHVSWKIGPSRPHLHSTKKTRMHQTFGATVSS